MAPFISKQEEEIARRIQQSKEAKLGYIQAHWSRLMARRPSTEKGYQSRPGKKLLRRLRRQFIQSFSMPNGESVPRKLGTWGVYEPTFEQFKLIHGLPKGS